MTDDPKEAYEIKIIAGLDNFLRYLIGHSYRSYLPEVEHKEDFIFETFNREERISLLRKEFDTASMHVRSVYE